MQEGGSITRSTKNICLLSHILSNGLQTKIYVLQFILNFIIIFF